MSFRRLLEKKMFELLFIFDQKHYKQFNGVIMGSPLRSTLTNVSMCHFEKLCSENCPTQFKSVVYRCGRHIFTFSFNRACRKILTSNTKKVHCHFKALKSAVRATNLSPQFVTSTFSGVFTNF